MQVLRHAAHPLAQLVHRAGGVRGLGPPALIVLLLGLGTALAAPLLDAEARNAAEPRLPLFVLGLLWAAFEIVALYLQFGTEVDNADEVILTEIPLSLGLLFVAPIDLLLVGVGVPVLVDVLRRRRSAIKQIFNGANRLVEVAVAVSVYRALDPAEPFSIQGWAVVSVAVLASALVSAIAVATVVSLAIGRPPGRDFAGHVVLAVPVSLAGAAGGFVAGLAMRAGSAAVAPLLVSLAALLTLMWLSSVLTERHTNLALLHRLGERLATTQDANEILRIALDASAEILVAPQVSIYVPTSPEGSRWQAVRRDTFGTLARTEVDDEDAPGMRGLTPGRRTVVASAPLTRGQDLLFSAARRTGRSRPFRDADSRLLDMVARQTGADLGRAQLIYQLRHEALHDPVTDLPNRRLMRDALNERLGAGFSAEVICFGVHDLEVVNGALGHDRGDELLVQFGGRLRSASGPGSLIARVGGDELAVLLPADSKRRSDPGSAAVLLETLVRPFELTGVGVVARASAGTATGHPGTAVTGEDLLRHADIAMRSAWRTGRPAEHYDPLMETATSERLRLAADLQVGIGREELMVYGQPQVRLSDGQIVGVEALVRWNHPRLGLLPPTVFVPLAEQTGLDGPMTAWVLNVTLEALAGWRAAGLQVSASVNVSPGALVSHQLQELTEELLTLREIPGKHLMLEITESGLLANTESTGAVLDALSSLGVRLSIDDFGTGFSSLSRLRHLPVDEIKIDRSFVRTMLHDDDDAAIVRSVVELGRALGLSCVAEGVEDGRTYEALQQLGCDSAQGFHIAAPMPLDQLADWMALPRDRQRVRAVAASFPAG